MSTTNEKELGLYDSRTGETVYAYKIFDVSELCPKSKQCVIKYATVARGTIAQICDRYEKDRDLGVTVHYHLNEMTASSLAQDEVFEIRARVMGANPVTLAIAIFQNQNDLTYQKITHE